MRKYIQWDYIRHKVKAMCSKEPGCNAMSNNPDNGRFTMEIQMNQSCSNFLIHVLNTSRLFICDSYHTLGHPCQTSNISNMNEEGIKKQKKTWHAPCMQWTSATWNTCIGEIKQLGSLQMNDNLTSAVLIIRRWHKLLQIHETCKNQRPITQVDSFLSTWAELCRWINDARNTTLNLQDYFQ